MSHTFDTASRLAYAVLFAALVLLWFGALAAAQAQDTEFSRGLLWRVDAPDAAPSFILGTFHSADPAVATPSGALRDVLDRVDSVTIEMVLDEANESQLGRAMLLTDGRRLSDIVGPERFARIVEAGQRYGIPGESLEVFRPWGVMVVFSVPPAELMRQASGAAMLDRVLQERAQERGIRVYGIETVEEQIAAIAGGDEDDQLALLDATLESSGRVDTVFQRLREAYLDEDLARLHELTLEEAQSAPANVVERFLDRIVTERNYRMAERIRPRLAEGNALIAVGALHLYGEDGLLGLLAAEGYALSRVE